MKRDPWQILSYVITAVVVAGWATLAFGQPPQPGDTPAPVVDSPDVFEVGLIEAYLEAPAAVEACSVLVLDVSGTSKGKRTLVFHPSVPDTAVQHDSDGDTIYVWIKRARPYAAWWAVSNASGVATAEIRFVVTPAGEPPPDDPGDPPPKPGDTAFLKYVRGLVPEEADNHDTVADVFRGIAKRIEAGELRGSEAIKQATILAFFGASAELNREWWAFNTTLREYMLNTLKLDTDKEWARHYRLIGKAVSDE